MRRQVAAAERSGQVARRGNKTARNRNREQDVNVLRVMREVERAALPPRKQPGDRRCLGCGGLFESKWCGNRLCMSCVNRA